MIREQRRSAGTSGGRSAEDGSLFPVGDAAEECQRSSRQASGGNVSGQAQVLKLLGKLLDRVEGLQTHVDELDERVEGGTHQDEALGAREVEDNGVELVRAIGQEDLVDDEDDDSDVRSLCQTSRKVVDVESKLVDKHTSSPDKKPSGKPAR